MPRTLSVREDDSLFVNCIGGALLFADDFDFQYFEAQSPSHEASGEDAILPDSLD
jgi:hypothetical protein